MIASVSGNATRLFAEKLKPGITSKRFPIKMKKKKDARSGRIRSACWPSTGIAICSRTNVRPSSIIVCSLPGTTVGARNAR